MFALDPENGERVWQRKLPDGSVSRPAAAAGAILLNSSKLGTYLLSPIDGSLIDGIHFDTGLSGTPAAYGRRAFVLTNTGQFLARSVDPPMTKVQLPASYHRALDGF